MYTFPKYFRIMWIVYAVSDTGCKKQVLSFRTVVKLLSNFMFLLLGKQLYILIHKYAILNVCLGLCLQF